MKPENYEEDRHYDDLEGNVRTFTVKDYSKKTEVYQTEKVDYDAILKAERDRIIDEILQLHPQTASGYHDNYIIRGAASDRLEWDEVALRDPGIPLEHLMMQKNVLTNRQAQYSKTY